MAAPVVHGHHHFHAVTLAGLVVIRAESRGGVDAAGTGIHSDVLRIHQPAGLGQEGVVGQHVLEEAARVRLHNLIVLHASHLHDLLRQGLGHDIDLAVSGLHQGVALPGVEGDSQVAGEGPDGGGPDDEEQLVLIIRPQLPLIVVHGELHIYGGNGVVLILNLGFR